MDGAPTADDEYLFGGASTRASSKRARSPSASPRKSPAAKRAKHASRDGELPVSAVYKLMRKWSGMRVSEKAADALTAVLEKVLADVAKGAVAARDDGTKQVSAKNVAHAIRALSLSDAHVAGVPEAADGIHPALLPKGAKDKDGESPPRKAKRSKRSKKSKKAAK